MIPININTQRNLLKAERKNKPHLNVVITGGTRGLGRSFAEEFAKQGDRVFILSRSFHNDMFTSKSIKGIPCDVGISRNLEDSIEILKKECNTIDIWINNAGMSGGARTLIELEPSKIEDIITTNLLGTCIACKLAHDIMIQQPHGGAIFNLAGAGSDGSATPNYPIYGATKAGIVQLSKSLQQEWKDSIVDLHVISPGMMLTDLLTDNINLDTLNIIEFLCTHPDLVASHLVPRIKNAYFHKKDSYIKFLTLLKIIGKILMRKN